MRTLHYQKILMELVLDEVAKDAPVQEAIVFTARVGAKRGDVNVVVERYYLPDLEKPVIADPPESKIRKRRR